MIRGLLLALCLTLARLVGLRAPDERIADGACERGFVRDCGELHCQPDFQIVEDRGRTGAAKFDAAVRRRPSGLLLDGIELRNLADGLFTAIAFASRVANLALAAWQSLSYLGR